MNTLDSTGTTAPTNLLGRIVPRAGAACGAVGLVVLGLAAPASAHVTVTPSTTAAGAFAVLEFSVAHGCDGASTTAMTIQLPPEVNAATPTRDSLWDAEKRMVDLDPPVTDAHGNELSERVESVTFTTDEPLVDGVRDTVELSVQIPDAEGTTLVFPVIQTCGEAESAWIEVPEDGVSEDELELPAPSFTVTAAGEDAHGDDEAAEETAVEHDEESGDPTTTEATADEPDAADGDTDVLTVAALVAGVLGVVLGGAALVLRRRSQ